MSNALDDLVADIDRLVFEMGSNLPIYSDETTRSWCASISAQFLAFNRRLRDAIKEERTSRQELEAFSLLENYAETPDDKLTDSGLALKRKLLRLGSSASTAERKPEKNKERFSSFDDAVTEFVNSGEASKYECPPKVVNWNWHHWNYFVMWLFTNKLREEAHSL